MTEKVAAYGIADAILTATSGIETMSIITLWLAIVFLGIGMARSAVYPIWLGWVAVVLDIAMVTIVGIPKSFIGYTSTLLMLLGDLALLTTVWLLVLVSGLPEKPGNGPPA